MTEDIKIYLIFYNIFLSLFDNNKNNKFIRGNKLLKLSYKIKLIIKTQKHVLI